MLLDNNKKNMSSEVSNYGKEEIQLAGNNDKNIKLVNINQQK